MIIFTRNKDNRKGKSLKMENKKLVGILLNDISGLEDLIREIKDNKHYESLDIEFLQTRAVGIRKLLEMLSQNLESGSTDKSNLPPYGKEKRVSVSPGLRDEKDSVESAGRDPVVITEITETAEVGTEEEVSSGRFEKIVEREQETQARDELQETLEEAGLTIEPEEEEPKILGEKFIKEKSLNDMLSDQGILESKLTNRPISNLQSAIGVNDRFLYIRELFSGDPRRFEEVVKSIDSMNSFPEAIDFLKKDFVWKKNETSLKFLNLVKRRFGNA